MKAPYSMIYDWQDALPEPLQPFAATCFSGAMGIVSAQQQGESQSGNLKLGGAPALLLAARVLVDQLDELVLF